MGVAVGFGVAFVGAGVGFASTVGAGVGFVGAGVGFAATVGAGVGFVGAGVGGDAVGVGFFPLSWTICSAFSAGGDFIDL